MYGNRCSDVSEISVRLQAGIVVRFDGNTHFSLQEVIASMAGRIIIVTTGLFQVGDRIQVGEIQGDVINIGFMRTSLMEIGNWVNADQHSGRIIHLTNAIILKENVVNYSGAFPFVWDEIFVPVRYGSDHHAARQILLNVVEPIVNPFKTMANEKWLNVKDKFQNIVDAFSQTGGKVEFASMTIEITNFPKLAVDVGKSEVH